MFDFFFLTKVTVPSQSMWLGVRFQKKCFHWVGIMFWGTPTHMFCPGLTQKSLWEQRKYFFCSKHRQVTPHLKNNFM